MALTKIKLDEVDTKATPVLADSVLISDSADDGRGKLATLTDAKAAILSGLDADDVTETATKLFLSDTERAEIAALYASHSGKVVDMDKAGCVADNSTDNYTVARALINGGSNKVLQFGPGTYLINQTTTSFANPPPNCTIRGAGKHVTILRFTRSETSFLNIFGLNGCNNLVFEDITLQCDWADTSAGNMFNGVQWVNARFTRVRFIGQGTYDITKNKVNLFSLVGGAYTRDDTLFEDCDFEDWVWVMQKSNTSTSVDTNLRFINCYFNNNITGHFNLNSPSGVCKQVVIDGCTFGDQPSYNPGVGHMLALSGVEDVKIINSTFEGGCDWEAMHLEECNKNVTIANNTIKVSNWTSNNTPNNQLGTAIYMAYNDIGRAGQTDYIAITGNLIERVYTNEETALSGTGIQFGINGTPGEHPAQNAIVSGNIIRNFKNGFIVEVPPDASMWITGNMIIDCTAGVSTNIDQSYFGSNKWVNCGAYTPENWEVNT